MKRTKRSRDTLYGVQKKVLSLKDFDDAIRNATLLGLVVGLLLAKVWAHRPIGTERTVEYACRLTATKE